jgi:hypothetical protein
VATLSVYYFHFIARTVLPDAEGTSFQNDQLALAHAEYLARELSGSELLPGCAILVSNEQQHPIYEVPLVAEAEHSGQTNCVSN